MIKSVQLSRKLSGCKPIVIASHPRSGTHLTIDTFRRQFKECNAWKLPYERNDRLYMNLDSLMLKQNPLTDEQAISILRRCKRPLIKTHAVSDYTPWFDPQQYTTLPSHWAQWLNENADFVYVYRDPRSVLCSYQLFMEVHSGQKRLPIDQFIRAIDEHGENRVKAWAQHVRNWQNHSRFVPLEFEQLLKQTGPTITRLSEQLGLTMRYREPQIPAKLKGLLHSRLNRLFALRPQSTAILGTPGGERPLKWREAFTQEDHQFVIDQSDNLLVELGYEVDNTRAINARLPEKQSLPPKKLATPRIAS